VKLLFALTEEMQT